MDLYVEDEQAILLSQWDYLAGQFVLEITPVRVEYGTVVGLYNPTHRGERFLDVRYLKPHRGGATALRCHENLPFSSMRHMLPRGRREARGVRSFRLQKRKLCVPVFRSYRFRGSGIDSYLSPRAEKTSNEIANHIHIRWCVLNLIVVNRRIESESMLMDARKMFFMLAIGRIEIELMLMGIRKSLFNVAIMDNAALTHAVMQVIMVIVVFESHVMNAIVVMVIAIDFGMLIDKFLHTLMAIHIHDGILTCTFALK